MPKIFVVEDDSFFHDLWQEQLKGFAELIFATNVNEAEERFSQNPDIDAIVMDGCLSNNGFDTGDLIVSFRARFSGPIIASSGSGKIRRIMVSRGCDYECDKSGVAKKLREIFGQ